MSRTSSLTERESLVRESVALVSSGRSLLIFGEAGIGKTYVSSLIAARSAAGGRATARLRVPTDGSALFFGPVTAVRLDDYDAQTIGQMTPAAVEAELAKSAGETVVHLDDAQNLTAAQTAWLISIIERRVATFVIAVLVAEDAASGVAEQLSELWVEERATRIDLDLLDLRQTEQMIDGLAGATIIDTATRIGVYRGSGGLPLLVRELVREVMDAGLETGIASTFIYPLPPLPSKRIIDIVWHRMRMLSDSERNALVVLARLEGLSVERAMRYLGGPIVRHLLLSGFVRRSSGSDELQLSHRIEAETVLAVSGSGLLARLTLDVAQKLQADLIAGMRLAPLEYVLVAETMLGEGADSLAGIDDAEMVAEVFLVAAAKSLATGTIYNGLSFARASLAASPSVAAMIEESRCLCAMGRFSAAVHALDGADELTSSPVEQAMLQRWRVRLEIWSGAVDLTEPVSGDGAAELRFGMHLVVGGQWSKATTVCARVAQNERVDALTRLYALGIVLGTSAGGGDVSSFSQAVALGEQILRKVRWDGPWEETVVGFERNSYLAYLGIGRIVLGSGVDELADELTAEMDRILISHDYTRLAILGSLLGFIDLCRGDFEVAEVELRLANDRVLIAPDALIALWMKRLQVESLVDGGRADEAEELSSRMVAQYPMGSARQEYAVNLSRYYFVEAERQVALEQVGEDARSPSPSADRDAVTPMGELSRMLYLIGDGADAGAFEARAVELRDTGEAPLLHGMADFVVGLARADAALLDQAADELGSGARYAAASTAATRAAQVHLAAGRRVAAGSSEFVARTFDARRSRRGVVAQTAIDLSGLTAREREIVDLVADGKTNREVARTLYLSVRTVESHFYQARVKLGAVSRRELTRLVRLARAEPPV